MRSIIVSLAFCVLITFVGVASGAQAPQMPATIREVFVDFTNQSITIEGDGFNTTGPVQVNLGLVGNISSLCNAAQEFFAACGHDEVGTIGTPTAINSGDMLGIMMIAVQALETQTQELKDKGQQIEKLVSRLEILTNALVAAGQLPASALSNAQITAMR